MRRLFHRFRRLDPRARRLIAGGLLVALLFQAMIPAGFMPAADGSLALEVCHSGLPGPDPGVPGPDRAAGHTGNHTHVTFCSFGALPGVGPLSQPVALGPSLASARPQTAELTQVPPPSRLERAHPARGPPLPSSRLTSIG